MFGLGKIAKRMQWIADQLVNLRQLRDINESLSRLADAAEYQVWYTSGRPVGIRLISIDSVEGDDGMTVSNVTVGLLPAKPTTVVQVVTVATAGFVTETILVPAAETVVRFAVPPSSEINMTVASRDAAENTSSPFVVAPFTAIDTVAPDSPDGIGAVSVNDTDFAEPGFTELAPE